jgi:hypothetical protein
MKRLHMVRPSARFECLLLSTGNEWQCGLVREELWPSLCFTCRCPLFGTLSGLATARVSTRELFCRQLRLPTAAAVTRAYRRDEG